MSTEGARKFRLRRAFPKQEIIQQNLAPLKQNTEKKKRAQAYYYNNNVANNVGRSPLVRRNKEPVHQRLGPKSRMVGFNGTNTSAILPRKKFSHNRGGNPQFSNKRTRIFTAQSRLNKIRQQQRELVAETPKKKNFRLRRTLPQQNIKKDNRANNFTIQVNNQHIQEESVQAIQTYRFRPVLNNKIQQDIKILQQESHSTQIIPPMRVTPVGTAVSLHDRFAEY